ncbi:UNVERIFIED_CONTAM: hypothetical protein NCL1_14962 [Trichonephila clavipes]
MSKIQIEGGGGSFPGDRFGSLKLFRVSSVALVIPAIALWESWWSNYNTGLRSKSFFPLPSLDINPHSSYVTQFLTNHGPFVSYLHRFKLKATPNCLRGSVGDADHYLCMYVPCNNISSV